MEASGMRQNLYLGMPQGQNFGWGVCGSYLHRELPAYFDVTTVDVNNRALGDVNGILLQPLEGQALTPWFRGKPEKNIGYVFFEDELDEASSDNSRKCDLILAGSTWCVQKMREAGICHTDVLFQGIDPDLFHPVSEPVSTDKFVIFSGGKFEFRKGQDLVLAAFKALQDKYKDLHLITAWGNSWKNSLQTMAFSPYIEFELQGETWPMQLHYLCAKNGIDFSRVQACPLVASSKMRSIYSRTNLGIFPNRCEGGTNLVLMEYMACGKPAIVSATSGHLDIINDDNSIPLRDLKPCQRMFWEKKVWDWEEPSLDSVIAAIEHAYKHRDALGGIAAKAATDMSKMTWKKMAENVELYVRKLG